MPTTGVTVVALMCLLAFLGGGCGGGDGERLVEVCLVEYDHWTKDDPPPPDMDNLDGTYALHSFDIDIWIDGIPQMPISSDAFSSFSGSMIINSGTISESITVDGETSSFTGTFAVSSSNAYYGTLHITDISGTYDFTCAIGPVTICDPDCQEFVFLTLANEQICFQVPESELDGMQP
ncbi:MAG: hypothetical protein JSV26_05105 [bacterium]|nr:MAG: hypothetical protein JSV26_05105 [bacterium]